VNGNDEFSRQLPSFKIAIIHQALSIQHLQL